MADLHVGQLLDAGDGQDDLLVVSFHASRVTCIDLVWMVAYAWHTQAGDGIRAQQMVCTGEVLADGTERHWLGVPVTRYPPPPEVAAYLRGVTHAE